MQKYCTTTILSVGILPFINPASAFESLHPPTLTTIAKSCKNARFLTTNTSNNDEDMVRVICLEARKFNWDDRIGIQSRWTNNEKGWKVGVEWKMTPYGAGLFATQDIAAGTLLRQGRLGVNLVEFQSVDDIDSFCRGSANSSKLEMEAKLNYVKDYLWGFNPNADERGYDILDSSTQQLSLEHEEARFFGMWVPGNGLNHDPNPNTVYRAANPGGTEVGIDLFALSDIRKNEELFDDYRRHGRCPSWLLNFASERGVTLNFAECNDFVAGKKDS